MAILFYEKRLSNRCILSIVSASSIAKEIQETLALYLT